MEILHQHQVTLEWLVLRVQQPAAIRGDVEAIRRAALEPGSRLGRTARGRAETAPDLPGRALDERCFDKHDFGPRRLTSKPAFELALQELITE